MSTLQPFFHPQTAIACCTSLLLNWDYSLGLKIISSYLEFEWTTGDNIVLFVLNCFEEKIIKCVIKRNFHRVYGLKLKNFGRLGGSNAIYEIMTQDLFSYVSISYENFQTFIKVRESWTRMQTFQSLLLLNG